MNLVSPFEPFQAAMQCTTRALQTPHNTINTDMWTPVRSRTEEQDISSCWKDPRDGAAEHL